MKTAKYAPPRRPRQYGFASVLSAARLQLCVVREDPEVRARHVAALLAFTPTVRRIGTRMRIRFEHAPTALWLTQAIAHKDVELIDVSGDGGTVEVRNPQIVLGRYGFREGRWVFGQGVVAAMGISRGAVHAAASFNRHGMKVVCPSAPMMLTLTAVMSRLGINAKPTDGQPRAAVSAGDVGDALDRLGIGEVAAQYRRLREATVDAMGAKS
ncbi:hypothetical protein [Mycobacterium xenopi]|uniref:hypothetical protein n=1 Tax=Mycobacterium xenopi TaxID=1789 RepID=UPI000A16AEC4|nr:hypothetical protein [Mycobacterium xenopi]ORX13065.1 hypothetical protein AWC32_15695 [Mycobacterium xenopi]SPX94935.1 Uncharacterised protein [Mycobacterium xenopi]